ncbi:hypothetical protein AB0C87_33970 [Actinomadura sp. NPDC048021]|uniref:hypothetical protein n=1 Tax=Actinomadura sp. NPDC048021 TaxID=3155385 RepID=UPI0033E994CD
MVVSLTPEFADFADENVADVVREAVMAHATEPDPAFEVILNMAAVANWRLRDHPSERRRVRGACYRFTPTAAAIARATRFKQLLGAVTVTR